MSGYGLLLRNASWVFIGRLASIALGLIVSTALFSKLGGELYGIWSLLMLLTSYSMVLDFGLAAAIERRVAMLWVQKDSAEIARTLTTALALMLAVLGAVQILVALAVPEMIRAGMIRSDLGHGLVVLPLCIAFTGTALVVGAALAGLQRMGTLHMWRTMGLAVSSLSVLTLSAFGVIRIDALLLAYSGASVFATILQWNAVHRSIPELRLRWTWDAAALADLISFGGVLQVISIVPPLAEYVFRLLLSRAFGLEYAGFYDLAARAAVTLRSMVGALVSPMVPFAVHTQASEGVMGSSRLVQLTVKFTALIVLPGSALLLYYGDTIVHIWLGGKPGEDAIKVAFKLLLVLHAVGSLPMPATMLGRAARSPGPEAVLMASSFTAALAVITVTPAFAAAVAVFWGFPAIGGMLLWAWLARKLGFGFRSSRDILLIIIVSILGYLSAGLLHSLIVALGVTPGIRTLAVEGAATTGLVLVCAFFVGVISTRELRMMYESMRRATLQ